MSTNDQPADDEQSPAPAQQVADIDAMLARARLSPKRSTAATKLAAQMLALIEEHERETVAARALAGDANPTDADPLGYVRDIAADYLADAADTRDEYLDRLADELSLDDLRALRVAGEAAVAVTPRVIRAEKDRGMKADRIADEVGLTVSRVYQILREQAAAGDQ